MSKLFHTHSLMLFGSMGVAKAASTQILIRFITALFLVFNSFTASALDAVSLDVGSLESNSWKLQGIQIALTGLAENPQKLTLSIKVLSLPKPFNDLSLINIHCSSFTWQNKELLCNQGHAQVLSERWQSPATHFSFMSGKIIAP